MEDIIYEIQALRRALHGCPELSMQENRTKEILKAYIKEQTDLNVVDRGPWFYAVYKAEYAGKGGKAGAVAFRADMDAVAGRDGRPGHYCGHDGHASILAGFGRMLKEKKPKRDVYLIFQPAEETGEGARLCRALLKEKNIKEIYGFHNIPGYERGAVVLRRGTFACASTGLELWMCGAPSHAAYPEHGKNPAFALSSLVTELPKLLKEPRRGMLLATVIGMEVGSASYGVSAAEGILRLTVRGEYQEEFEHLVERIREQACGLAEAEGLECRIREIERFPSTENHDKCVERVARAARGAGLSVICPGESMRWSEDFGYYLQELPGAFFGIGDGENYAQLHTEAFEFPDEIIPAVLKLYSELCTI